MSASSVCHFRASGDSEAPAVGYCLVFVPVNFGPQGILGLQLPGIVCSFVCQFRASGDSEAPAVGYCLFFLSVNFAPRGNLGLQLSGIVWSLCLSILGLRRFWRSSSQVLCVLFVFQVWALVDSGAPAFRCCLFFVVCQFQASGDSGLQLLGIVCFFSLSIFGLRGFGGSICRVTSVLFV